MTKLISISSCIIMLSVYSFSQELSREWIMNIGGNGGNIGSDIVCDSAGNVYICGYSLGIIYFNNDSAVSNGSTDVLVAKINPEGDLIWVKTVGGKIDDYGLSVDIMQNNSLYISGVFKDTAAFGDDILISEGDRDLFLAKMDLDGNIEWGRRFGGKGMDVSMTISIHDENIYATGGFRDTAYFEGETLISYGNEDIFIAKFNSEGEMTWIKQMGSDEYECGQAIETDEFGNAYVAAYFRDTCYFPIDTLISRGSSDLSLSKIDADGNMIWLTHAGGSEFEIGAGLCLDEDDNLHFSGTFGGTLYVEDDSLVSGGFLDAFFLSFDGDNGQLINKNRGGGKAEYESGQAAAADRDNNVYYSGYHNDTTFFDNESVISHGDEDIIICQYNANGELLWLENAGGKGMDRAMGMTVQNKSLYITGQFADTLYIEDDTLISESGTDIFLFKYLLDLSDTQSIEEESSEFRIYPIPAEEFIHIEHSMLLYGDVSIEIIDIQGKILLRKVVQNNTRLNISDLSGGIYMIRIIGADSSEVYKFIKN